MKTEEVLKEEIRFTPPMLARSYNEEKDAWMWNDPNVRMELKHHGHRLELGHQSQWSRQGNDKFFEFLRGVVPTGTLLDGEIKVIEGSTGEEDERGHNVQHYAVHDQTKLEFVAWDILFVNGVNVMKFPLSKRLEFLKRVFSVMEGRCDRIGMEPGFGLEDNPDRKQVYQDLVEAGHEGVILKKLDAPYGPNSRAHMVKVKGIIEYDVVITDCASKPTQWTVRPGAVGSDGELYEEGLETESWRLGYVNLSYGYYDQHGVLRRVGSLGMTGLEEDLKKYVGMVAECKSFGPRYKKTGALCNPQIIRWRDPSDKKAEDCVFKFPE